MNALTYATELAAVEAAFAPVRITALSNFSPTIERDLRDYELDRDDFEQVLDELAFEQASPLNKLTNLGEWFNDYVLAECNAPEFSDDETNRQAREAYWLCPELRSEFAHWWMRTIVQRVGERRERAASVANESANEY